MTLDEALKGVGRRVAYRSQGEPDEEGVITSAGLMVAHVRYDGDTHSKATRLDDLTLIADGAAAGPDWLALGAEQLADAYSAAARVLRHRSASVPGKYRQEGVLIAADWLDPQPRNADAEPNEAAATAAEQDHNTKEEHRHGA
jgi:hypothetical protein